MRTSSIAILLLAAGLPAFAPSGLPAIASASIQATTHPSGIGDAPEKKYGPKWCQKHPRKCAKAGGLPP